jgi:hypothetical protein
VNDHSRIRIDPDRCHKTSVTTDENKSAATSTEQAKSQQQNGEYHRHSSYILRLADDSFVTRSEAGISSSVKRETCNVEHGAVQDPAFTTIYLPQPRSMLNLLSPKSG